MADYKDEITAAKVEMVTTRWVTTGATIVVVALLSALTFSCADSRSKEAEQARAETQITASQKVECVKAGGSWMPIQGVKMSQGSPYPDFEMGCVSQAAQQAVMAQNAKVVDNFKPEK